MSTSGQALQPGHDALDDLDDVDAFGPTPRSQHGGDLPTRDAVVDAQVLVGALSVPRVEQGQLLGAMHRIVGIVEIQQRMPRGGGKEAMKASPRA